MDFDGIYTDGKLIGNGLAGIPGGGNFGVAFSRVGPAKSGTSPLTPPTGQDFAGFGFKGAGNWKGRLGKPAFLRELIYMISHIF
jgi:hypothetical protein